MEENVRVTVGAKGYQAEVKAGNHTFFADEPQSIGGTDSGPKPEDLILSALGACIGITLRMYADRKDWPLDKTEVKLTYAPGEITTRKEGEKAAEPKRKINGEVLLHGALTGDQIKRLDEISHKCPIHKALQPAFAISLQTAPAAPEYQ